MALLCRRFAAALVRPTRSLVTAALCGALLLALCSCKKPAAKNTGADENVQKLGTVEVTAKLVEIPPGAIFKRELYDYAAILKYEVVTVHRGGPLQTKFIYVGHYNPTKPRSEAADRRVKNIGGNLQTFAAGQLHRMALEVPLDDHFMGGIVNKYFGTDTGPLYWAVWTNGVEE